MSQNYEQAERLRRQAELLESEDFQTGMQHGVAAAETEMLATLDEASQRELLEFAYTPGVTRADVYKQYGRLVAGQRGGVPPAPREPGPGPDLTRKGPGRSGRVQPEPFRTDDGHVYVQVPLPSHHGSNRERLVLFAPLNPRSAGAPLPRQLTASLSISPQVMAVVSRTKREFRATHLFVQDLTWTVRLPEKPGQIDLLGDPEVTAALTEARANRLRMGALQP